MHVLTKIFVVLVSLLAVLLVPLVVTYAHNENSYQSKHQSAQAGISAARAELLSAQAAFGAAETKKNAQLAAETARVVQLRKDLTDKLEELVKLETRVAEAENLDAEIHAQLATLAKAVEAGQELNRSLIDELRTLRTDALLAERQKVELDEALREKEAQLEVAVQARRSLEEELQRLKDEHAGVLEENGRYIAQFGEINTDTRLGGQAGLQPDRDLDCRILTVRRSNDQVLAEIDAGSLDGVREGWIAPIGRDGFIANIRIIRVDINRSTGVIELESASRGQVLTGDRVLFRASR